LKNKFNLFFQLKKILSLIYIRKTNYSFFNIKKVGFYNSALTLDKTYLNSNNKDEDSDSDSDFDSDSFNE